MYKLLVKVRIFIAFLALILSLDVSAKESTCFGSTSNGRLVRGVKLPSAGINYVSYSKTAELLGRTFVHSTVKEIIIDSYQWLEKKAPNKVYKYAETGFEKGGHLNRIKHIEMDYLLTSWCLY